jgi:hypothetical protein
MANGEWMRRFLPICYSPLAIRQRPVVTYN